MLTVGFTVRPVNTFPAYPHVWYAQRMQNSNRPRRLIKPFGAAAGSGFIRSVPNDAASDGAASYEQGFPPETFQPVASGGKPPSGADMNGVLYDVSGNAYAFAAGMPAMYDAAYTSAIGGYPRYALLASTTPGRFYQSTVENNTTDPDGSGSSGWTAVISPSTGGTSSLVANGGYDIQPNGLIKCWGAAFSPANQTITVPLPVGHTTFSVVSGSCSIPQDEMCIGVVTSALTGFTLRNGNPRATTFYWHSYGV
jgi:hypothetical protein